MTPAEFKKLCEDLEHHETPKWAAREILRHELLTPLIVDPCCGTGILSEVAREAGHGPIYSADIYNWGYLHTVVEDFLTQDFYKLGQKPFTVFMNPPFSKAEEFVRHCHKIGARKIVCFQRFAWWESEGRAEFWDRFTPQRIYICGSRATCWRHDVAPAERLGKKGKEKSTPTAHAWFIWEKGQPAGPVIGRIYNPKDKGPLLV